jgi:hypothetical protein
VAGARASSAVSELLALNLIGLVGSSVIGVRVASVRRASLCQTYLRAHHVSY